MESWPTLFSLSRRRVGQQNRESRDNAIATENHQRYACTPAQRGGIRITLSAQSPWCLPTNRRLKWKEQPAQIISGGAMPDSSCSFTKKPCHCASPSLSFKQLGLFLPLSKLYRIVAKGRTRGSSTGGWRATNAANGGVELTSSPPRLAVLFLDAFELAQHEQQQFWDCPQDFYHEERHRLEFHPRVPRARRRRLSGRF